MPYSSKIDFGWVLKSLRMREEWEQKEIAKELGISERTYQRYEAGFIPPASTLKQIAGILCHSQDDEDLLFRAAAHIPPELCIGLGPQNHFFTGREAFLQDLKDLNETVKVVAIIGLPGVGKTQLALEYAYRSFRKVYRVILWVNAASKELLLTDFAKIAKQLNLPEKNEKDQEQIVGAVKHWLEMHTQWLLIFDNADELALVQHFKPSVLQGRILLTTCTQILGNLVQKRVEISPMKDDEGSLFLLRRANILSLDADPHLLDLTTRTSAAQIVAELGGHPLALDQTGAYIEAADCLLSEYLPLYQQQRLDFLKDRGSLNWDHPDSVLFTFLLCFKKAGMQSPLAIDLLKLCAFLHPDSISEEIITKGTAALDQPLSTLATDQRQRAKALATLRSYSLIQTNQDDHNEGRKRSIHRLVQIVLIDSIEQSARQKWAVRAVQAINCVFPHVEVDTWQRCQQYLPQAQICADLIFHYQLASPEASRLLSQAGYYLYKRGRYDEANPFLQRALTISEQIYGLEHTHTATSLHDLALLYQVQGKYKQAEQLFGHALAIREQILGSEHPDTATSLNNLAGAAAEQGKYEQAEPLYQRALTIREQVLGPEHPDTAVSLNHLAVLYANQGKYEQAEKFSQRDLAIKEKILGTEHPDVAESLHNLASFYHTEGKYEQAEPLYQRALALFEKVLGSEHSYTAFVLDNLAGLYTDQGKYEQAESLSLRALMAKEKALGPQHPDVSQSLITLALIYQKQGKYEQAEPLYQRAVMIYEKALGPEHPFTGGGLTYLAILYTDQGKYEQAESLSLHALKIKEQALGPEHSSTAISLNNLAEIYRVYGKHEQAEALGLRALAIREKVLSPQHPDIAASVITLVNIYRDEGKYHDAEQLQIRVLGAKY